MTWEIRDIIKNKANGNTAIVNILKDNGYVSLKVSDENGREFTRIGFDNQQMAECLGWYKDQEDTVEEEKEEAPITLDPFKVLALAPGLVAKEIDGRVTVSVEGETYTKQEIVEALKEEMRIIKDTRMPKDILSTGVLELTISAVAKKLGITSEELE